MIRYFFNVYMKNQQSHKNKTNPHYFIKCKMVGLHKSTTTDVI